MIARLRTCTKDNESCLNYAASFDKLFTDPSSADGVNPWMVAIPGVRSTVSSHGMHTHTNDSHHQKTAELHDNTPGKRWQRDLLLGELVASAYV
jgi:hypothetical protein